MTCKDQSYCRGCRNDFYNGKQNALGADCWSLKDAKVVTRWKLAWWTQPTVPRAFEEVRTYDCHHETGQFAFYKALPDFAVEPRRLVGSAAK